MDKQYNVGMIIKKADSPDKIINQCIKNQLKMIIGFKGNKNIDWKKYEEAQKPKHFAISLSGEPTIYPFIKEAISYAREKGIKEIEIQSNCLVLADLNKAKELQQAGQTGIFVTIHSDKEEIFEQITRVPGSFKKTMQGIKNLINWCYFYLL